MQVKPKILHAYYIYNGEKFGYSGFEPRFGWCDCNLLYVQRKINCSYILELGIGVSDWTCEGHLESLLGIQRIIDYNL